MDFLKPIKSDIDYKLLVLLALDSIGRLTKTELDNILIKGEYSDYFSNTFAVEDLLSQKSIEQNDVYYEITEKGKSELRLFSKRIPSSIKSRFLINALQYKDELLRDRDISLNFQNIDNNRVIVTLYIFSEQYELMKIELNTLEESINFNCLNKIKRNKITVYESIINLAFTDKSDKLEKTYDTSSDIKYFNDLPYLFLKFSDEINIWSLKVLVPSPDMIERVCIAWPCKAKEVASLIFKKFFSK